MTAGHLQDNDIAIIGLGCRFPRTISSAEDLWQILINRGDQVTEIPTDRWNPSSFYHAKREAVGTSVSKWGSFLEDIGHFDPLPFGLSAREAKYMDPQQRLALEVSYEAIENAGIPVNQLSGKAVGVFFGASTWDYSMQQSSPFSIDDIDPYSATGMALSVIANRVSYCLNLKGPSLIVDTACSSSLMAIHLACQSIFNGESEMAIAGGVNAMLNPGNTIAFSKMGILSSTGRCRAFSDQADGFARGEGAGAVLLMPLQLARSRGYPIYASIVATGANQDGTTNGLAVPNGEAQITLLKSIYAENRISPDLLGYFEAHGTGTEVGDAIEANSIGAIARQINGRTTPLPIGSVKTNFGHLESASGILGFLKAVLVCQKGIIPPNLHFDRPSQHIDFNDLNIRVVVDPEELPSGSIVGVNSFGFGGANAHIALRALPQKSDACTAIAWDEDAASQSGNRWHATDDGSHPTLLIFSADSPTHLARSLELHLPLFQGETASLPAIASSLVRNRMPRTYRWTCVGTSKAAVAQQLTDTLSEAGADATTLVAPEISSGPTPRLGFVFTGQGNQWIGMGLQLRQWNPAFRESFDRCEKICQDEIGLSILDVLNSPEAQAGVILQSVIAQPAITAFQIALVALWEACGVRPAAVVGHSVGEIAAAYAAGTLSLEDAMRMSCRRGKLVDRFAASGQMLAISCPEERLKPLLDSVPGLEISAYNSPRLFSVGGAAEKVAHLEELLAKARIAYKAMPLAYAFHTELMEPCRDHFGEVLAGLRLNQPSVPFFSTVTGQCEADLNADYWWRNLRHSVRFSQAIATMTAGKEIDAFIEISPHPTLVKQLQESARSAGASALVIPSCSRSGEIEEFLGAAGRLWALKAPIDLDVFVEPSFETVPLPSYPWLKKLLWQETFEMSRHKHEALVSPLLGRSVPGPHKRWLSYIDKSKFELLNQHLFRNAPLYPAAGYIEMLYAASREINDQDRCAFENLEITNGLFLNNAENVVQLMTEYRKASHTLEIHSRVETGPESWQKNCHGRIVEPLNDDRASEWARVAEIMACNKGRFPGRLVYFFNSISQLQYGPDLQLVDCGWALPGEVVAKVRVPASACSDGYLLHPGAIDACFHSGNMDRRYHFGIDSGNYCFVPLKLGRIEIARQLAATELIAYFRKKMSTLKYSIGDIFIFDGDGTLLVAIEDYETYGIDLENDRGAETLDKFAYQMSWQHVHDQEGVAYA